MQNMIDVRSKKKQKYRYDGRGEKIKCQDTKYRSIGVAKSWLVEVSKLISLLGSC